MERPLFWHQGLFLQPQHFQLGDLYFQSLLKPFYKYNRPHFWGVGKSDINTEALGNLTFNLLSCDLVFPDMTHVVFPGNALVEGRSFDEDWVEGGKPLKVYIGIKKWNESGENVTVLSSLNDIKGVTTRFVSAADEEEVPSFHESGPSAQVKKLHYVLRIFWGDEREKLGDYVLIPLAELIRSGEEIMLSQQYIPPCLTLFSSEALLKIVTEIRDQVASRGHVLESYKRSRGIHTAEFGARDMVFLLALRSLNRYIPQLFHLTESQPTHPWTVYSVLRQLIGELSSFSDQINVIGEMENGTALLAGYDHRQLWECFSSARSLVARLLDEITAGPEYIIQLSYDGAYYAAELSPSIFEGRNRFYMVMETEADPKSILQSLVSIAKLSSRESLPILIARALPGIKLSHLQLPPQELPRRAHSLYFQIDQHSDQWSQVHNGKNIALFWDNAPDDLKVELMVVGRN